MAKTKLEVREVEAWYNDEEGWFYNNSWPIGTIEFEKNEDWNEDDLFVWLVENANLRADVRDKIRFDWFGPMACDVVVSETDEPLYSIFEA